MISSLLNNIKANHIMKSIWLYYYLTVLRMQINEDVFSKVTSQEKFDFDGFKIVKKISRSSAYIEVQVTLVTCYNVHIFQ